MSTTAEETPAIQPAAATSAEVPQAPAAVPSAAPAEPAKVAPKGLGVFETVLVALLVSGITLFCYDHYYATKFVIADLDALTANLTDAVARGTISVEDGYQRIDQAKAIINNVGKKKYVLLASVVLGKDKSKYSYLELPFVNLPDKTKTTAPAQLSSTAPATFKVEAGQQ